MLQQLQKFSQSTSKEAVKEIEDSFDQFYCNNPENATREALSIITNNELGSAPRQLAATFLYSFVDRRWRMPEEGANQNIREAQQNIKQMLLQCTMENVIQDKVTLRKFASVVARICRFDFPALWRGGPFEPILSHLTCASNGGRGGGGGGERNTSSLSSPSSSSSSDWLRHQMLFVMHLSLKEIVSNRVPRAQQAISDAAAQVLQFVRPLTAEGVQRLVSLPTAEWKDYELLVREVETLAKIVLRCAATINLDVGSVMASLDFAVRFATVTPASENSIMLADRFSEIVCWAVEKHGVKLPDENCFVSIGNFLIKAMQQQFSERMHAHSANALKCLLDLAEGGSKQSQRIRGALQNQVLTPQTVEGLIRDLVARFFRDTDADIDEWNEDPEQYVIEHDESNDEENAAHASEQFFLSLVASNWDGIVELVWKILTDALNSPDPSFIAAALHAIGLGYACLGTPDQFVAFLREKLVPAMQNAESTPPVVLRRVVWVIGMWCDSLIEPDVRRRVMESFADLLDKSPHPVVILTCLRAVSHLCTDSSFKAEDIFGRPLEVVLNAVKAMLEKTRSPETTSNLVGLVFISSSTVVAQLPEAHGLVKRIGAYRTVMDCLEGYVQRAAQAQDSDSQQCTAASIILQTLNSAFEHNLLDESETRRSLDLAIRCADVDQPIHVWTEDEAWEVIATFMSRGSPPDIARTVMKVAALSVGRDFYGRQDVVKALAYLTIFCGDENASLFSPAIGDTAIDIICKCDEDSTILKHNSIMLLEGIIRRFPDRCNWAEKVQDLFKHFGNADVGYDAALDALACCLCFERQTAPIAPALCSDFIAKCVECADVLTTIYAKLLMLQGLANMMSLLRNTEYYDDANNALEGLRETVKCGTTEEVESHWSSSAVGFLMIERMNRL